jgi:hypothetical protein
LQHHQHKTDTETDKPTVLTQNTLAVSHFKPTLLALHFPVEREKEKHCCDKHRSDDPGEGLRGMVSTTLQECNEVSGEQWDVIQGGAKQSTGEVLHHGFGTWKFYNHKSHRLIESFPVSRPNNLVQLLGHQGTLWKCADSQGNYYHTNPHGWTFQG